MKYTTENSFLHFPSIKDVSALSESERKKMQSLEATWCVTEKLDGSNFQIVLSRRGYTFCTRNQKLDPEQAAKVEQTFPKKFLWFCSSLVNDLKEDDFDTELHFFGELFGNRVIDRIPYEKPHDFRCFGMCVVDDGKKDWFTQFRLRTFFSFRGMSEWVVPMIALSENFEKAISLVPGFNASFVSEGKDCLAEGFVVSPYTFEGDTAHLPRSVKVKNPEFSEMEVRKYGGRVSPENRASLEEYRERFRGFCNRNRMVGIFSKQGKPKSIKEAGDYCRWFVEDAYRDFLSVCPEIEERFSSDELRELRNIGSQGFLIFKELLG